MHATWRENSTAGAQYYAKRVANATTRGRPGCRGHDEAAAPAKPSARSRLPEGVHREKIVSVAHKGEVSLRTWQNACCPPTKFHQDFEEKYQFSYVFHENLNE